MKIVHIIQLLLGDADAAQPPKPKACDEEAAKYDRYLEEWKKDYQKTKEKRRAGVQNRTLFTIDIMFPDRAPWTMAMMARRELIAAGYESVIKPEIDEYSNAVFVEVSRSTCAGLSEDVLWKQVKEIVGPFGGEVDNGGLIEDPMREQQLHRLQ
jgi:hypothetical protein